MGEDRKENTIFLCRFVTFVSEDISVDLMNSSATFQRLMNAILCDFPLLRVYIDYLVIFSRTL